MLVDLQSLHCGPLVGVNALKLLILKGK